MKTFSTSGTGNQQTLEEIESDKIPVYSTEADLDADLANLSVGQIVATKDTGDELSQPVDVVEEGNLHAVTSDAVARAISPNYANKQLIFDGLTAYTNNNYVAPSDGIITACGWGTGGSNSYIVFNVNDIIFENQGAGTNAICVTTPVRKGDVIEISIYLATNNYGCYFVPYN